MIYDAIIIGAGVIGCSIAWRLSQANLQVAVIEKKTPGSEASSAAAGILGPAIETHVQGPLLTLGLQSRELHQSMAKEIFEICGVDVGFRRSGVIKVALTEQEMTELRAQAALLQKMGITLDFLSSDSLQKIEPVLTHNIIDAFFLGDEAQIDPINLMRGLVQACQKSGVHFYENEEAICPLIEKNCIRGLKTSQQDLSCKFLILASGSWSTKMTNIGLPEDIVIPVRGQMIALSGTSSKINHVIFGSGGYLVPRMNSQIICGSTMEQVGYERGLTVNGLYQLLERSMRLIPTIKTENVEGSWSGFRPASKDGLPLIGTMHTEGFIMATGHHRNGILLSAMTANMIRDIVLARSLPPEWSAFDPKRFF